MKDEGNTLRDWLIIALVLCGVIAAVHHQPVFEGKTYVSPDQINASLFMIVGNAKMSGFDDPYNYVMWCYENNVNPIYYPVNFLELLE